MQRNTIAIILIVVILVLGGGAIWYLSQQNQTSQQHEDHDTSGNTNQQTQEPSNSQTQPSDQGQQGSSQQVIIKDSAYSPARLTVKKGTTVTWTNEDTIKHNVVASDSANTGGLPTTNPLLNKDETYSFTFNQVGTFNYLCTPHASFMKGIVEVTE